MINPERFLFVLGGDPVRWAARYDIEPFSFPCKECGVKLTTSIPFVCGPLRGLMAPTCRCGNQRTPYAVVREPGSGDLITGRGVEDPTPRALPRSAHRALRLISRADNSDA